MSDFTERIEKLVKEKKIPKMKFYSDVGIGIQALTDWRKRNTIPAADIAVRIADYLNTSVEFLVTGTEKDTYKGKYDNLKNVIQNAISEN